MAVHKADSSHRSVEVGVLLHLLAAMELLHGGLHCEDQPVLHGRLCMRVIRLRHLPEQELDVLHDFRVRLESLAQVIAQGADQDAALYDVHVDVVP